jgi:hypothetical protein
VEFEEHETLKESGIYAKLGLDKEDEMEKKAREHLNTTRGDSNGNIDYENDDAAMPYTDYVPSGTKIYDKYNPEMHLGAGYPDMKEFRLAIRQWAMNRQFDLGLVATTKVLYRGKCRGADCHGVPCPWRICATIRQKGAPVIVCC